MPCELSTASVFVNPRWNAYFLVGQAEASSNSSETVAQSPANRNLLTHEMHDREQPSVLLQTAGSTEKSAMSVVSGELHRRWTTALLFVRMMGGQIQGSMLRAATSSPAAMLSMAALMCVIVITAYLFLQAPGNLNEKDGGWRMSDGTVHESPAVHAARVRAGGGHPRQGSRQILQARQGYTSVPGSSVSNPYHNHAGLAMPHSASVTPVSTGMTLPSKPGSPPQTQSDLQWPMTSQPEPPKVATKGLCPGLIVPPNSECVLAIRAVNDLKATSNPSSLSPRLLAPCASRLDILDLQGKPVMKAQVVNPWPRDTQFKQRAPVVTVSTINGTQEERLTFCRAGGEGGGHRSMYIYDKDDVLFGCIKRDVTRPRYVLTSSRGGLQLLFEGNFVGHTVSVLSDGREMLSHAEPCGMMTVPGSHFYQVRVAAGVDVGLIVSGLLSIDAMETM